jgi:hypothetical protein
MMLKLVEQIVLFSFCCHHSYKYSDGKKSCCILLCHLGTHISTIFRSMNEVSLLLFLDFGIKLSCANNFGNCNISATIKLLFATPNHSSSHISL